VFVFFEGLVHVMSNMSMVIHSCLKLPWKFDCMQRLNFKSQVNSWSFDERSIQEYSVMLCGLKSLMAPHLVNKYLHKPVFNFIALC